MAMKNDKTYTGSLKAVVFDWAGTTVDFGCCAPAGVFVEAFKKYNVDITTDQARGPMGTHKRDHVRLLLENPAIGEAWKKAQGSDYTEEDVERIYQEFIPLQIDCILDERYSRLVPGVPEMVGELRERGLKVGSCTGYTREMIEKLLPIAEKQGYKPDAIVCSMEVPTGRPSPLMIYKNMVELDVWPGAAIVKVGDTVPDILEGHNAGCWTVGLTMSGNEVGLGYDEYRDTDADTLNALREHAASKLRNAGAHYIIDTVADLVPILDQIETRLALGENP